MVTVPNPGVPLLLAGVAVVAPAGGRRVKTLVTRSSSQDWSTNRIDRVLSYFDDRKCYHPDKKLLFVRQQWMTPCSETLKTIHGASRPASMLLEQPAVPDCFPPVIYGIKEKTK